MPRREPTTLPDGAGGALYTRVMAPLIRRTGAVLAGLVLLSIPLARAQLDPEEVELDDVIAVELVDRDLLAFDLLSNASPSVRLELGETLVFSEAQGRVAVAITDRRVLAASPGSAGWREVRYRVHENGPTSAFMGTRVALIVSDKRALGFDGDGGLWIQADFGPNERPGSARVGAGTAVVLTNRRAIGLSPDNRRFTETKLAIHENVSGIKVRSNMATVSTDRRLLVFRAPSGVWTEQRRPVN